MVIRYCETHPRSETNLLCSKCSKPICPSCMIETPIGMRCGECAGVSRLPTFDITGAYLARSLIAGLLSAVLSGASLVFIDYFLLLSSIMGLVSFSVVGYVVGTAVSFAVNGRRGRILKIVAATSVFFAFVILSVSSVLLFGTVYNPSLFTFLGLGIGVYIAINRF